MNESNKMNAILYGGDFEAYRRYHYIKLNYNILAVCDSDKSKKESIEAIWDRPYISPCDIIDYEFDCILIASTDENEIRKDLIEDLGIPKEKLKSVIGDYFMWWQATTYHSFGEKNSDKVFYVICRDYAGAWKEGLFSWWTYVMKNIRYALENEYIPIVDMQNFGSLYMEKDMIGKINAWEQYFRQPIQVYR